MRSALPILTAEEMESLEKTAYTAGASEEEFMEKAGEGIARHAQALIAKEHLKPFILLLTGPGNNGGDAYVAGRILLEGEFKVTAIALAPREKCSKLSRLQMGRFEAKGGHIFFVEKESDINFVDAELIIDGIFGTGFHGSVEGLYKSAILKANDSKKKILSIDIPSGIHGTNGKFQEIAINATETVFLGYPKVGCFMGDAWNNTGKIQIVDFGLKKYINQNPKCRFYLIDEHTIDFPGIRKNWHKYERGYVVGVGGRLSGASLLASISSLRSGAGITRLFYPENEEILYSRAPLELVLNKYSSDNLGAIAEEIKRAKAFFIGSGFGLGQESEKVLKEVLGFVDLPLVIDGDGLTIISKCKIEIPKDAILTPHVGELKRLLHKDDNLLEEARAFAQEKGITLVFKGSPTFIFSKEGEGYVMARGDPGMATAGSGDVLTGIIAGLLCNKDPLSASILGTFLHAIAGELAAMEKTSYSITAQDLSLFLPQAFRYLLEKVDTTRETSLSPSLATI